LARTARQKGPPFGAFFVGRNFPNPQNTPTRLADGFPTDLFLDRIAPAIPRPGQPVPTGLSKQVSGWITATSIFCGSGAGRAAICASFRIFLRPVLPRSRAACPQGRQSYQASIKPCHQNSMPRFGQAPDLGLARTDASVSSILAAECR